MICVSVAGGDADATAADQMTLPEAVQEAVQEAMPLRKARQINRRRTRTIASASARPELDRRQVETVMDLGRCEPEQRP